MALLNKVIPLGWQRKNSPPILGCQTSKPVKSAHKKGYFWVGLLFLTAFAIQEFGNLNWCWLAKLQTDDVYKQLSGFTLVGYLFHQWRCSILRNEGLTEKAAKLLNQHKMLGSLAPAFFYVHAQHIGYAYLQALSLTYFAIFITGLCNFEITHIHKHWFHSIWIFVHVGLATGLVFLVCYHIFISYAFQ